MPPPIDINERIENDFAFHPALTDERRTQHDRVRAICRKAALDLVSIVPHGREQSLVVTKLEEAMFWANAGVARPPESE